MKRPAGLVGLASVFFLTRFLLFAVAGGPPGFAVAPSTQVYRLLPGSKFTTSYHSGQGGVVSQTTEVEGSFRFAKVLSPLDWESFQVEDMRIFERGGESLALTGGGFLRYGGRGVPQLQVELRLDGSAGAMVLTNTTTDPYQDGVKIQFTASTTGSAEPRTPSVKLTLVAVPAAQVVHYRLLEGSELLDDCPICDRLSRPVPLRGEFDLVLYSENPLQSLHVLENARFVADPTSENPRTYTVSGEYSQGGEVAVRQQLRLQMELGGATGPQVSKTLTNSLPQPGRLWPVIGVDLDDTDPQATSTYHVTLYAAPVREIWFSTRAGLTSGLIVTNGAPVRFSGDDLLSEQGRRVWSGAEALQKLELGAGGDVPRVDCIAPSPGGEVLWSLDAAVSSPLVGKVQEGDVLADPPVLWKSNQDLIGNFGLQPPAPDLGLDALQVLASGEVLFSTRLDGFSEVLGTQLRHGDLLSNAGQVKRTNQDLLGRFKPKDPAHDYGLDAVYVWSSGEIWFSVAEGFEDAALGVLTDGDLLSDQGYLVCRNKDLLAKYQPLEDLAQFGLDSLVVLSDAEATVTPPVMNSVSRTEGALRLRWNCKGRAVQIEQAASVGGPYRAATPILVGSEYLLPDTPGFYRLRQW